MDREAVERAFRRYRQDGSAEALGALFDGTAPELARIARHLASTEASAEDLLQSTFLTLIEKARELEAGRPVMPWMVEVLVRHAGQARRRARRRPDPRRLPDERAVDASREAAEREWRADLARSIERLPATYRPVLSLLLDGHTPPEVARRLSRAQGTVRVQIARALARLRRSLPLGSSPSAWLALDAPDLARVRAAILRRTLPTPLLGRPLEVLAMTTRKKLALALAGLLALTAWVAWSPRASMPSPSLESRPLTERSELPPSPLRDAVPADWRESVQAEGPAPATSSGATAAPPITSPYPHTLEIVVRRGEDGPPVSGIGVRLSSLERVPDLLGVGPWQFTDTEGRALFEGLEPDVYRIHLDRGAGPGLVRVPDEARHVVVLAPGLRVAGRVLDPWGTPVEGARVLAWATLLLPAPVALTDSSGAFELSDIAAFTALTAEKEGLQPSLPLSIRSDDSQATLVLRQSARRIVGTVRTPVGAACPGALVILQPAGDAARSPRAGAQSALADLQGRFAFAGPGERARVLALPPSGCAGVAGACAVPAGTGDAEVEVRLRHGATLMGHVHGAGAGASSRVESILVDPLDDFDSFAPWLGRRSSQVSEEGDFRLEGLVPGEHELTLSGEAGALATCRRVLAEGSTAHWEVRPDAASVLEVCVEPPLPPPSEGYFGLWTAVLLQPVGSNLVLQSVIPAKGCLRIPDLEGGPFVLSLTANPVAAPSSRITIATQDEVWPGDSIVLHADELPSAVVRGHVTGSDGRARVGAPVVLWTWDTLPSTRYEVVTEADGGFRASGLPAGQYRVEVDGRLRAELALARFEETVLECPGCD